MGDQMKALLLLLLVGFFTTIGAHAEVGQILDTGKRFQCEVQEDELAEVLIGDYVSCNNNVLVRDGKTSEKLDLTRVVQIEDGVVVFEYQLLGDSQEQGFVSCRQASGIGISRYSQFRHCGLFGYSIQKSIAPF